MVEILLDQFLHGFLPGRRLRRENAEALTAGTLIEPTLADAPKLGRDGSDFLRSPEAENSAVQACPTRLPCQAGHADDQAHRSRFVQFMRRLCLNDHPSRSHSMRYTVVLEQEADGGYVVSVPALPGCVSQGDTRAEALDNIREAIELYVEDCREAGDPVPTEAGKEFVEVEAV